MGNSITQNRRGAEGFYNPMQNIGNELHEETGAFNLAASAHKQGAILDTCMAPGGFLSTAMQHNEYSQAVAFSLPRANGGHEVFLPENDLVMTKYLDITMLAADMGLEHRPSEHPESQDFIMERQLPPNYLFDLVLCDGHVLRTHPRPAHREPREARRLIAVQLALGLEHTKAGGTMVVRLNSIDKMLTAEIIHQFSLFSQIEQFKPTCGHNMRSSFYLVASDICTAQPEVASAVGRWKEEWRVATFGTDEEYQALMHRDDASAEKLVSAYGEQLVQMGRRVWSIQAQGLANAPFMRGSD